jgi:hypothetical protein
MKNGILFICCILFNCCYSVSSAAPVLVLTDNSGFRAVITDAGIALEISCDGERLACDTGYSICSEDGIVGALGGALACLKTAPMEIFPFYYTKGSQATTPPTFLTKTGTENGVPVYNVDVQTPAIPAGTIIYWLINNKPAAECCLGVHSFYSFTVGTCCLCVRRKIYNTCNHKVAFFSYKEFVRVCSPFAVFSVVDHIAQASIQVGDELCNVSLQTPGNVGASQLKVGSVAEEHIGDEFLSCALTPFFKEDQQLYVNGGWLEGFFNFNPGCVTLAPAGKGGFEKFIPWCVCLQCSPRPPGGGCPPPPPGCECPDIPPPGGGDDPCKDKECPLSQGYWKTHSSAWPVSTLKLGNVSYTKAQLLTLLGAPIAGDASLILAKQLIAAKLNVANGACSEAISQSITAADDLLKKIGGTIPLHISPSSSNGQAMTAFASMLELFNTGKLTPSCK